MVLYVISGSKKGGCMPEINTKLNLNDRETIQISIVNKQPIKRIAKLLKRHASTILSLSIPHPRSMESTPNGTTNTPTCDDISLIVL